MHVGIAGQNHELENQKGRKQRSYTKVTLNMLRITYILINNAISLIYRKPKSYPSTILSFAEMGV